MLLLVVWATNYNCETSATSYNNSDNLEMSLFSIWEAFVMIEKQLPYMLFFYHFLPNLQLNSSLYLVILLVIAFQEKRETSPSLRNTVKY